MKLPLFFTLGSLLSLAAQVEIPEGVSLELFADDSQVMNPTAVSVATDGKVYVAETHRWRVQVQDIRKADKKTIYPRLMGDISSKTVEDRLAFHKRWSPRFGDFDSFRDEAEKVRVLEDRNGDGKADDSHYFRDDFNEAASGAAGGILAEGDSVYLANIPGIYKMKDLDGDGKAEEVKTLVDGMGVRVSFSGHDLSGLVMGPDGRLYFSLGDRGYHIEKDGQVLSRPDSGAIFRCWLDGSGIEEFFINLRNPREITFDAFGNLFTVDNNYDKGDRPRIIYLMQHGDAGWRMGHQTMASFGETLLPNSFTSSASEESRVDVWANEGLWQPWSQQQPAYIVPPIANFSNGPAGLTYAPGGQALDESYDGSFFLADYRAVAATSGLLHFKLNPKGAGFKLGERGKFLRGLCVTDVDWGYDGKMYVSDFIRGWMKPESGNIFTVYDKSKTNEEMAALMKVGFSNFNAAELVKLLENNDMRVRRRAQFALVKCPEGLESFRSVLASSESLFARVHAVWGLGQLKAGADLAEALNDGAMEVRANAARTLGDIGSEGSAYGAALIERLSDPSDRVKSLALIALANLGVTEAVAPALKLLESDDPFMRHSVQTLMAECSTAEELAAHAQAESVKLRRSAVVALRRQGSGLITAFLDDESRLVRDEAVRAIYDDRRDSLVAEIAERLESIATDVTSSDAKHPLMAKRAIYATWRMGREEDIEALVSLAGDPAIDPRIRRDAVLALYDWNKRPEVDPVTATIWKNDRGHVELKRSALQPLYTSLVDVVEEELLLKPLLKLAELLDVRVASDDLLALVRSEDLGGGARLVALKRLGRQQKPNDEWKSVLEGLYGSPSKGVRGEALRQLSELDAERGLELLGTVFSRGEATVVEKQAAIQTLAEMGSDRADVILAAVLKDPEPGIALDAVLAARESDSKVVRKALEEFESQIDSSDRLASWRLLAHEGGRIGRGKNLFFNHGAAQCQRCHAVDGAGGEVGPPLSDIGAKHDSVYLLDSLIDPSHDVAPGYGFTTVSLVDGGSVSGLLMEKEKDGTVTVKVGDELKVISPSQISRATPVMSAMPPMAGILTQEEVRDMVAYLVSRTEDFSAEHNK